jgi:CheY-like chemotaxis protein
MHKPRLLIVDDKPDVAGVFAEMARQCEYRCLIADCGMTALEIAGWWLPNVVVVDLDMPDDGYGLCSKLRSMLDRSLLIAVSDEPVDQAQLYKAEFHHYLVKPVSLDRLKDLLAVPRQAADRGARSGKPGSA